MASNPAVFPCPKGVWTKVATNVVNGRVYEITDAIYSQTIRLTGGAAPTTDADAARLFEDTKSEPISSSSAIDVYVKALDQDGSVRVDL